MQRQEPEHDASPASDSFRDLLRPAHWTAMAAALRLSDRETEVVKSIFQDRDKPSIANQLDMSPHTVHSHLERIYDKLGVSSRAGLILRVAAEFLTQARA